MDKTTKVDKTDPICGMKGTIPAHGHFFCSEHCIKKYEALHGINEKDSYCPSCAAKAGTPWYKERLFIVTIITIIYEKYMIEMQDIN